MDRRAAIESLAPVHAHALSLLDSGLERSDVAARLGLDVDELTALVRVAEAKVERIMKQAQSSSNRGLQVHPGGRPDLG